ncbi:glycoside hydrolase [Thamnidium elegans]|nr:glycoside hydrolase [Thamnidium elegans]
MTSLFHIYCCISLCFVFAKALIEQTKPIYGSHQLITYVVDWDIPTSIPWDKLDHIAYAFAVPNQQGELTQFDEVQLKKIIRDANRKGKGVSLAVGGWTGSIYFSSLVRTSHNRQKFAQVLVNAVDKYRLNGLNIDWEYPNDPNGISCNRRNPEDTDNFLKLIKLLREMLEKKYPSEHKLITAAVSANVFLDQDRKVITNLERGWATYMDAFYIMAYDINGVWSNVTAANAPLYFGDTGQLISADSSIQSWINAGIPSDRIYLGVPFYGYTQKTLAPITRDTGMNVSLDRSIEQIKGDKYDDYSTDPCPGATASFSGEIQWRSIVKEDVASNKSGWTSYWDEKTRTPYSYNDNNRQFITYDNPISLRIKSQYVEEHKLGGMMLWSLEMDDQSDSLLNALQSVRR